MHLPDQISKIRRCLVEIATPFNTGTGFYIKQYNVIVTNEHVVRDNKEVVIKGESFEKQIASVLLIDEYADIAFIAPPKKHEMPELTLRLDPVAAQGEPILAMGHPYGLKISTTRGVVSSIGQRERGLVYIQHDAALNPGNSGGPLIDGSGSILGLNSFVLDKGENVAFALPLTEVKGALEVFSQPMIGTATRCIGCRKVIKDSQVTDNYCCHCGAEILFPSRIKTYVPLGIAKIIEEIIVDLGYDVRLAREGRNHWNIQRGSALVRLSYHKDAGLIDGDAYLCRLPEENVVDTYMFLMRENAKLKNLAFSVKDQNVLLSLLIYDRHLDEDTGRVMLEGLFEQADYYDNVLIEKYGATWINQQ